MTTLELRTLLNAYGIKQRPQALDVDHETYANVCHEALARKFKDSLTYDVTLTLGDSGGVMFRGVEIKLKKA